MQEGSRWIYSLFMILAAAIIEKTTLETCPFPRAGRRQIRESVVLENSFLQEKEMAEGDKGQKMCVLRDLGVGAMLLGGCRSSLQLATNLSVKPHYLAILFCWTVFFRG